jgi:N-acyl amino acid synthase of PEP-CTERM/exosortase system
MCDLINAFEKYFEVVIANTPELRREAFKLRYDVVCYELPDCEPGDFPDGLETDEYDSRAIHSLLYHRPTGALAGTVRLILPDTTNIHKLFPLERCAREAIDPHLVDLSKLPRTTTAEISRMILARQFRSRGRERFNVHGVDGNAVNLDGRRQFPHPVLGLIVALMQMSAQHNITHWYAIMEPVLNRMLRQFSLELTPIGSLVNYHGLRQPHLDAAATVLTRVFQRHRCVWELVTSQGKFLPGFQ